MPEVRDWREFIGVQKLKDALAPLMQDNVDISHQQAALAGALITQAYFHAFMDTMTQVEGARGGEAASRNLLSQLPRRNEGIYTRVLHQLNENVGIPFPVVMEIKKALLSEPSQEQGEGRGSGRRG